MSPSRSKRLIAIILILSLIALSSACSSENPEIVDVSWRVRIVIDGSRLVALEPAGGIFRNAKHLFGIFVAMKDTRAAERIQSLTLLNEQAGISWNLDEDRLTNRTDDTGRVWLGSDRLTMPEGTPIPNGVWVVQVMDARGNTDETTIDLTEYTLSHESMSPDITLDDFPRLSATPEGISIVGSGDDPDGLQSVKMQGASANALYRSITPGMYVQGTDVWVWIESAGTKMDWYVSVVDRDTGIELISGPYTLPIR